MLRNSCYHRVSIRKDHYLGTGVALEKRLPKKAYRPENRLRGLDIDDLYILYYLADKHILTDIAHFLNLSRPAITQRGKKIKDITGIEPWSYKGNALLISEESYAFSKTVKEAMDHICQFFPDFTPLLTSPRVKKIKPTSFLGSKV